MAQITEKELSALGDLLSMEQQMHAKCCYMASTTGDAALKDRYGSMAQRHQRHLDQLYTNLK